MEGLAQPVDCDIGSCLSLQAALLPYEFQTGQPPRLQKPTPAISLLIYAYPAVPSLGELA